MNTPVFLDTVFFFLFFFFFCICNFLAFVELGAGMSVQMRIPVLIPGASYWD